MEFIEVVAAAKREAKGDASATEIAWLHDPAHRSAWIQGLVAAIHDADAQFKQQRDRLDRARADAESNLLRSEVYRTLADEYDAWLKKASRYRLGLEQRLIEIRASDKADADVLREAIRRHCLAVQDPRSEDLALWAIL